MSAWLPGFYPPDPPERAESFPARVHMFEPLECFIERKLLLTLTRRSLAAVERGRAELAHTPDQQREFGDAIRQREEFLRWLEGQTDAMIYVALYPTSQFERTEHPTDDGA